MKHMDIKRNRRVAIAAIIAIAIAVIALAVLVAVDKNDGQQVTPSTGQVNQSTDPLSPSVNGQTHPQSDPDPIVNQVDQPEMIPIDRCNPIDLQGVPAYCKPDPGTGKLKIDHLALIKRVGDCRQISEYPDHDATSYACQFESSQEEHRLFVFGPAADTDVREVCDPGSAAEAKDFPAARRPVLIGPDPQGFCLLANMNFLAETDPRGLTGLQKILENLEATEPQTGFSIWQ